ncbi:MAG: GTPase HflX, partial [Planctomycetes bacterium]|nr:GTPase HflX [Planctomycetota bacterium]
MATSFLDSEELIIQGQTCVLVRVVFPEDELIPGEGPLEELAALAETAGLTPKVEMTQNLQTPNPASFCGKGKVEEIADICQAEDIKVVIFDNELKPQQQRVLSEQTKARVMDRTELILQIFAEHARTHQSKVAVELARLQYQLPRLRNLWSHLERQRGAVGKMGGAGERQIETDRRLVRDRIAKYKRELVDIEARRSVEVNRRQELFQAALVGYTNAGKSTLMNALTEAGVYAADQLFATLDTRTRVWEFDERKIL